jgi:hypothetical protein
MACRRRRFHFASAPRLMPAVGWSAIYLQRREQVMRIEPEFWNCSFWSSTLIIIGALLDWATLVVDPKGMIVPDHVARSIKIGDPNHYHPALLQSPEQKSQWVKLIGRFYDRMMKLSYHPENTFSDHSIVSIESYLMGLPSYDEMTKERRYPEDGIVHLRTLDRAQEDNKAQWLTEYMLHLKDADALRFLESVVLKWALELPQEQLGQLKDELLHRNNDNPKCTWTEVELRGYALYRIAEGLEH